MLLLLLPGSLLLVHVTQLVYLLQDLYLEILNDLLCDFWALFKSSNSSGVIIDGQNFVDLSNNLFLCIALKHGNPDLVENWVLQALLGRWSEEGIVLEHVKNELNQLGRARFEHFLDALVELGWFVGTDFHLIVVDILI